MTDEIATGYHYAEAAAAHTEAYLWEPLRRELEGRGQRAEGRGQRAEGF